MPRTSLVVVLCVVFASTVAAGQNLCPTGAAGSRLLCLIPATFENGLVLQVGAHQGHFGAESFLSSSLTPLNSAVGSQSALLRIPSPASVITFTWDSAAKVFTPSEESLGPVLGERSSTIGRHRLFVGFSYQYFKFDSIDGLGLKKDLPAVFTHADDDKDVDNVICSINPRDTFVNEGACGFVRDVIKTTNKFDLKIHQFTTFVTYGVTDRIDVSVAIPIENVRMGVSSHATIVNNSLSFDHEFPDCACFEHSFSSFSSSSGVGDMTLRVKGTAWKGERAGLALGVDVRVPTGDELNFLGAGAPGVKPFLIWSYHSRISPHVLVGYEVNGSSVLAGDVLTGNKEKLPSELTYSGGADVRLTRWLTASFDLIGEQVFQARRMAISDFTELGACKTSDCNPSDGFNPPNVDPNLSQVTGSYNQTNASVGAKLKPVGGLVITLNAEIKLN